MVSKDLFAAVVGMTLLAWSALAHADGYRPDEFLGLDLSKAVLSPKPLGPPSHFAPIRFEAGAEPAREAAARAKRVAHTRLAPNRRNPLDAQAFDARIQVWPCHSGGICNWKR
jgi:hypothetical protein